MKNIKVKNRKNRTLRNGKNKRRVNNLVTSEMIKKRIFSLLENRGADILEAAKEFYKIDGRGCVNISLTNHPNNPFKTGQIYYVTEEGNKELLLQLSVKTEDDIRISEMISAYEPTMEAVVYVWYDTMYYLTKLSAIYSLLGGAWDNKSLTVH